MENKAFGENKEADKKKYIWYMTPLQKRKFKVILSANPSFANVFSQDPYYNLTKELETELSIYCKGENHRIITICGDTGTGKSTIAIKLALAIAKINGVNFPEDTRNISFTFESVLENIRFSPRNSTNIADESVLREGQGSKREMTEIRNVENTTRKDGQNLIWVYPYANVMHKTAHISLMTIAFCKELRLTKVAVLWNNTFLGYAIIPVGNVIDSKLWQIYNKRKDDFIAGIKNRNVESKDYYKLANDILFKLSEKQRLDCDTHRNCMMILRRLTWLPMLTENELSTTADYVVSQRKRYL